jgi:hypothetical protein
MIDDKVDHVAEQRRDQQADSGCSDQEDERTDCKYAVGTN